MRKLLLFTFLFFISFISFGQSIHLKFRNIEIDGNVSQFVEKLKEIGYTVKMEADEAYILNGIFIGKESKLCVLITEKTKTVWGVGVYLPENSSWEALKSEYKTIKEQLVKKYGSISSCTETFTSPFSEGDGLELSALEKNKCTYVSYWELKMGTIMLKISNNLVIISYYDKINAEKSESEKTERIFDDL